MVASLLRRLWLNATAGRRGLPESDYFDADDTVDGQPASEDVFEPWDGPLGGIPASRSEMYQLYGDPGTGKVDPKWERDNMVVARNLPGPVKKRYVHRKMEPYLREALRRCVVAGCAEEITKMGSFAFRHQRHDPSRPLSDHAFGVALDINPKKNRARRYLRRNGPEPFSERWFELWPEGLSEDLVRIFEAVGFEWGGRWESFPDPMHFSLRTR